ncbi:MAG TPA: LEA type 2 family protein, partial [Candidatus Sulfotelmatobacter sp.]|nr:LEA type 2 family protein [Candidatus Sulfotelmatobacter sp.]
MKRKLWLCGLVSLAITTLTGCVQPSPPQVKYLDYRLGRITTEGIEVNFNFEVSNPNPLQLDVTGYSYKVFINDKELVSADHQGFSLAASAKTKVSILALVTYDHLFG